MAEGNQILISGTTAKEVENEQLNPHFHGNYPLKRLTQEIPIYEVLRDKDQKPKKPSPKDKERIKIPPMDYYGGLPESLNLKVKEVFEKGKRYKQEYRFDEAIEAFKRCLKLKPTDEEKGALYILIGNCFYNKSKYKEAFSWYNKGMDITKKTGDRAGLATTYNNIGLLHYAKGNYQETLRWYEKSVQISEEIGDRAGLAATYNNIGEIYRAQGNYQEALKWYEKSRKISEEIGNRAGLATTYNNIASIHHAQGNYQEALKWSEKSVGIFKEVGSWHSVAVLLSNIGVLYRAIDEKDVARQYLKQSEQLYIQLNLKSEAEEVKRLLEAL